MRLHFRVPEAVVGVLSLATQVVANADKIIFLGPESRPIPLTKPTISDLHLPTLTPELTSIRANLSRVFPNEAEGKAKGESAWLLLDNLTEGQRYEFRVCWAAIQPTEFAMDVYELGMVWNTPDLMVSLANYAYARMPEPEAGPQAETGGGSHDGRAGTGERKASVMFLHIQAAADYFTTNESLMERPPPVLVDLILDPYLFNVVPRSLLTTIGYVIVVAILSWFVARSIAAALRMTARSPQAAESKKKR